MEISGAVVSRPFPGRGIDVRSHSSNSKPSLSGLSVCGRNRFSFGDLQVFSVTSRGGGGGGGGEGGCTRRRRGPTTKFSNSRFSDNGHEQYYSSSTMGIRCGCGEKEKDMAEKQQQKKKDIKKRLKLVKGLSRDLSMFSDLGFGLDPTNRGLVDRNKGNMITEATELLLGQLQQLRAEEEELQRKRKEEKAKRKAAAQMQKRLECELQSSGSSSSSSSSSSESSSDSECGEAVDVSSLKTKALAPPIEVDELQPVMQGATLQLPNTGTQEANTTELQSLIIREANTTSTTPSTMDQKGIINEEHGIIGCRSQTIEQQCFTTRTSSTTNCNVGMAGGEASSSSSSLGKKVEVCMGGKCKKSGAAALLDEFQRVLGAEGAVAGCKCMGKCRNGPNVKILNHFDGVQVACADDSVRVPTNPLCIGVGLGDVGLIVAEYFGDRNKEMGLAAAS